MKEFEICATLQKTLNKELLIVARIPPLYLDYWVKISKKTSRITGGTGGTELNMIQQRKYSCFGNLDAHIFRIIPCR